MGDLITRHLQNKPACRKQLIAKSDEWKRGDRWLQKPDGPLQNFDDALGARFHPRLMRAACDEEENDLRVGIILNADDVEVCNPLGTARGDHKECGVQAALLNLPADTRCTEDNIMLVALAKAKVYKKHGMARILAGVDADGEQHDEPNVARDLRALDCGRMITIPDDDNPGCTRTVRLRVWPIMFSADYLGAQSVLPFVESPMAHVFCRGCLYNSTSPMAGRPYSFLRAPRAQTDADIPSPPPPKRQRRRRQSSGDASQAIALDFPLREWQTLKEELVRLRAGVSKTELKEKFHDCGLNKLYFALDPEYFPHIDPCTIAPQDLLHLFPDGLLRSELAWLVYIFCKLGLNLDKLNARLRAFKPVGFPKDVRIPNFPDKLMKGAAGGVPHSSSTARMTGSQCMHFTLFSAQFFDPLLTPAMRQHPAWASWVKLVELFTLTVQHELHTDDVERIDDLVIAHSQLFDAVPEYYGLKRPKHHFATHLALDLWRFGPPRGYWCFGFEHFNQLIKRAARHSNWKNTTVSVMRYWSARSARALMKL